jgi:hypothetical protein
MQALHALLRSRATRLRDLLHAIVAVGLAVLFASRLGGRAFLLRAEILKDVGLCSHNRGRACIRRDEHASSHHGSRPGCRMARNRTPHSFTLLPLIFCPISLSLATLLVSSRAFRDRMSSMVQVVFCYFVSV